ncbi:MAG: hypothetical protein ACD_8C00151G0001 [uncultured bacterium]|nr:MAG: hypothetical protein ACD_8C00151G0001 [uncultured bacterium]
MNQKTKIAIIILILLVTVGVLVFLIMKSKEEKQVLAPSKSAQEAQNTEDTIKSPEVTPQVIQRQIPDQIEGKIVGISRSMIVIDHPTGAFELNLKKETVMTSSVNPEELKTINLMNLKAGLNVRTKVDPETKDVLELIVIAE